MKKSLIGIIVLVAIVVVIGVTTRGSQSEQSDVSTPEMQQEVKVAATIFPLFDLAQNIAGDDAEVVLMLPPGASPHTFEPKPSLVRDLDGSAAVFAIGHNLDNWAFDLARSQDIPVHTMDQGVAIRDFVESGHDDHDQKGHDDHDGGHEEHADEHHDDEHGHEEEGHDDHGHKEDGHDDHDEHGHDDHVGHNHGPTDPHYWLDFDNAKQIARTIADELSELDPDNAADYQARATEYVGQLDSAEIEFARTMQPFADTPIVAMHDAWYYFAAAYDLDLVGTFEPSAGKEPTPQYLQNLSEEVVEHGVQVIFMEPQLSTQAIQAFANDNNVSIATIDPLGGVDERDSYIGLMRYNIEQIVNALQ